jgi:hypothetical protein
MIGHPQNGGMQVMELSVSVGYHANLFSLLDTFVGLRVPTNPL